MGTKKKATVTVDVPAGADDLGAAFPMLGQFSMQVAELDTLAQGGYIEAALARVGLFAKYLRSGDPMPTGDFLRLCSWLDEIAGGKDPSEVFGLKKKTGTTPKVKRLNRLADIAFCVHTLNNSGHPLNDSNKDAGAISRAAAEWKVSESEARLAWEVFGKGMQDLGIKGEQGLPNLKPLKNKQKTRPTK